MRKVEVRGADGSYAVLAFVREADNVVYVCALNRAQDVEEGDDEPVVGFPKRDVRPLN